MLCRPTRADSGRRERPMDRQVDSIQGLPATVCDFNGWLPWIRILERVPKGPTTLRRRFLHNADFGSDGEDSALDGNRFGRRCCDNRVLGTAFLLRNET
jgi:hypothetical protein